MKKLIFFSICLTLIGCTHVDWKQTTDECYIYGKFSKNNDIVWDGSTIGPLASGPGTIVVLDKNGAEKQREETNAYFGAVAGYRYAPLCGGLYLGKKNNSPKGFGSLIRNDTIYLGYFKKGILYSGNVYIYTIDNDSAYPYYVGAIKKGKPDGYGSLYQNGSLCYQGGFRNGKKHGIGKEYNNSNIIFDGSFKSGKRSGIGREYVDGIIVYEGEWRDGRRNGEGSQFNEKGLLVYSGKWKNNEFDGKGKLYKDGQCIEGKWADGRLEKSISTSVLSEIGRATKRWMGKSDALESGPVHIQEGNNAIPATQTAFIEQLNVELEEFLTENFEKRVEKRFGFWHLPRMIVQPWLKSDIKRANAAQNYFCKKIKAKDVQNLINAKIDYYNKNTSSDRLQYITLDKLANGSIVNTDVAIKVFEREALETTDVVAGILIDILICVVIAFIIGFFVGLFFPFLIPYAGIIDLVMAIIAFGIGIYISFIRTTPVSVELEQAITQMMVENYMQWLDMQNIIPQMIGLL